MTLQAFIWRGGRSPFRITYYATFCQREHRLVDETIPQSSLDTDLKAISVMLEGNVSSAPNLCIALNACDIWTERVWLEIDAESTGHRRKRSWHVAPTWPVPRAQPSSKATATE